MFIAILLKNAKKSVTRIWSLALFSYSHQCHPDETADLVAFIPEKVISLLVPTKEGELKQREGPHISCEN